MNGLGVSAALRSGKGLIRKNNEDAYYFNGQFAPLEQMDHETAVFENVSADRILFAICDGMGGYENGEVASYTAVSNMRKLQDALKNQSFSNAVSQWTKEANRRIFEEVPDGGCTLTLLYFDGESFYTANIGDSRIYQLNKNQLKQLTKDHSKVQILVDAGLITREEAHVHPQRHVITRFLGMDEEEAGRCVPAVSNAGLIQLHDRFLLCSDGVSDMLSDEEIRTLLAQETTVEACAENIYQAAMQAGGRDNATLIVVEIEQFEDMPKREQRSEEEMLESTYVPGQFENRQDHQMSFRIQHEYTLNRNSEQLLRVKSVITAI